jgi:carboxylesterase type B
MEVGASAFARSASADSPQAWSDAMTTYWSNVARTGDPNGPGPPKRPRYTPGDRRVLHLDVTIKDAEDAMRPRYEATDAYVASQRAK